MDTEIQSSNDRGVEKGTMTSTCKIYYAGFWIRFWAYLLDILVIASLNRIFIYPAFRFLDLPMSKEHVFTPIVIVTTLSMFLYFVIMTKYYNQTIGKMVFGLKVIDLTSDSLSWSTVLFREVIGKFISKTIFFVGFIVVAFTHKNQGVHDLFADTSVILERYSEG